MLTASNTMATLTDLRWSGGNEKQ